MIKCTGHPKANVHAYVYEDILVIEKYLARHLNPDIEVIHHTDDNKQNNDLSNLTDYETLRTYAISCNVKKTK